MFEQVISSGVKAVSAGFSHSMMLMQDGSVWATGQNFYGNLGDGTATERHDFVQVSGGVEAMVAGCCCYHSMVLKQNGTAFTTGRNQYGQLGDNSNTQSNSFVEVIRGTWGTVW